METYSYLYPYALPLEHIGWIVLTSCIVLIVGAALVLIGKKKRDRAN